MQNALIDDLILRARHAFMGSKHFNGVAPDIADSDILVRHGVDFIALRKGEKTLAAYAWLDGRLVYAPDGVVQISLTEEVTPPPRREPVRLQPTKPRRRRRTKAETAAAAELAIATAASQTLPTFNQ